MPDFVVLHCTKLCFLFFLVGAELTFLQMSRFTNFDGIFTTGTEEIPRKRNRTCYLAVMICFVLILAGFIVCLGFIVNIKVRQRQEAEDLQLEQTLAVPQALASSSLSLEDPTGLDPLWKDKHAAAKFDERPALVSLPPNEQLK